MPNKGIILNRLSKISWIGTVYLFLQVLLVIIYFR